MAIKGWTDGTRLQRVGNIAIGYIDENKNIPKAVDYFVVPPEVQEVYGEKPCELDIMLPHEDLEVVMPAYLKRYGNKFGLICRGTGETAHLSVNYGNLKEYGIAEDNGKYTLISTGEILPVEMIKGRKYIKTPCLYKSCPSYITKKCKEICILSVLLYKVPGAIGVYSIDTSSYNSYQNIKVSLEMVRAIFGRVSFIPLRLKVVMQEKNPIIEKNGEIFQTKRAVPIMCIDMGQYTLEYVLGVARDQKLLTKPPFTGNSFLPIEPPNEDIKPELLYPARDDDENTEEATEETVKETGGKAAEEVNMAEPVPYQSTVTIVLPAKEGKTMVSAIGKDDKAELVLLCQKDSSLKETVLSLQPDNMVNVSGQLKENGKRFVMMDSIEILSPSLSPSPSVEDPKLKVFQLIRAEKGTTPNGEPFARVALESDTGQYTAWAANDKANIADVPHGSTVAVVLEEKEKALIVTDYQIVA